MAMHSHRVGWNRIYTQRCMCTHVHSQLRCTHNVVQLITWHMAMHSHRVGWNRIYTQRCMCTHVHSQLRCTHNVVQLITWHKGWLEPHTYTVYDHTFGDFPAKNTICTPCIYGSGQSYIHTVAHVICGTLKLWHTAMHPHCGSHTVEHSSAITLWFTHTVAHSSTPTLWFTQ